MDRNRTDRISDRDFKGRSSAESLGGRISVASRRSGFARIRAGILDDSPSAILVTGEGGAGKTWLWTRVVQALPASWRFVSVDLTSAMNPIDFLQLVGDGLGLKASANLATARLEIIGSLKDEASEGRSWLLVLEDAQGAPTEVWEEIRVLSNRLGQVGGFGALVIAAQTELIRRLTGRSFASVAGRISEHIHLPPLDLDECTALINEVAPPSDALSQTSVIEKIHRDARGNTREILRLARRVSGREANLEVDERALPQAAVVESLISPSPSTQRNEAPRTRIRRDPAETRISPNTGTAGKSPRPGLPLVPSRPPLRLEEGLIEVGWQGEVTSQSLLTEKVEHEANEPEVSLPGLDWASSEPEITDSYDFSAIADDSMAHSLAGDPDEEEIESAEEWVEDPYAALQAWSEWAKNRERAAAVPREQGEASRGVVEDVESPSSPEMSISSDDEPDSEETPSFPGGATLRAEGQQDFAPYGQLFNESRKSRLS